MSRHDEPKKQSPEQWLREYLQTLDQWAPSHWHKKHIAQAVLDELSKAPMNLRAVYGTEMEYHQFKVVTQYIEFMAKSMAKDKVGLDSTTMALTVRSTMVEIFNLGISLKR